MTWIHSCPSSALIWSHWLETCFWNDVIKDFDNYYYQSDCLYFGQFMWYFLSIFNSFYIFIISFDYLLLCCFAARDHSKFWCVKTDLAIKVILILMTLITFSNERRRGAWVYFDPWALSTHEINTCCTDSWILVAGTSTCWCWCVGQHHQSMCQTANLMVLMSEPWQKHTFFPKRQFKTV